MTHDTAATLECPSAYRVSNQSRVVDTVLVILSVGGAAFAIVVGAVAALAAIWGFLLETARP